MARSISSKRFTLSAFAVATLIGCGSSTPNPSHDGKIALTATIGQALSVSDVTRVAVTVSGPSIPAGTPITDDLVEVKTTWQGIIGNIPTGADHVHGDAYDTNGNIVFSGDADVTITAGNESPVLLVLEAADVPAPFGDSAPIIDSLIASADDVAPNGVVHLTVNAHDPDNGDTLTYAWSDASDPAFSAAGQTSTDWTAPNAEGTQTITVKVTDSQGVTAAASVTIDVSNSAPVVVDTGSAKITTKFNTFPAVTGITADPTLLDVNQSTNVAVAATDADGDTLTYDWSTTTCTGSFDDPTSASPVFTLSALAQNNVCDLIVLVSDGNGGTNTGSLTINTGSTVMAEIAPVIDSTFESTDTTNQGDPVVFRVAAHDQSGGTLSFSWTASTGDGDLGKVTSDASTSTVTWTTPKCAQNAVITVTVTSSDGASVTHPFVVTGPTCLQSFSGIEQNVPQAAIEGGGWTQCFSGTYNDFSVSLDTMKANCTKANLMLACRPVGASNFTIAANAPHDDVLFDTDGDINTPHDANGVGWYYSDSLSMGFAPLGAPIFRNQCDVDASGEYGGTPIDSTSDLRLCWHTGNNYIGGGWRCGSHTDLNSDSTWERVIYQAD